LSVAADIAGSWSRAGYAVITELVKIFVGVTGANRDVASRDREERKK
jgi:hypothetical protein